MTEGLFRQVPLTSFKPELVSRWWLFLCFRRVQGNRPPVSKLARLVGKVRWEPFAGN